MKPMRFAAIELPLEMWQRLVALAGGSEVAARMLLEQAIERAMRAELEAADARHRAEVSRQRERFGWRW